MTKIRLTVKPSGTTGEINPQSGDYKCQLHPEQIIPLSKGEKFPPCNTKGNPSHGTKWILVKAR